MSDEEALKLLRKEVFKDFDLPGSSAIWKLTLSRTHLQLPLQKLARNQLLCFGETVLLCVCAFASLFHGKPRAGNSAIRQCAPYQIVERKLEAEQLQWKRGFWQDPTWKKPTVALNQTTEIMRKHHARLRIFRGTLKSTKS